MSVAPTRTGSSRKPAADPADLAGWPLEPKERRDFFHRPRAFPRGVQKWRKALVDKVLADPDLFPDIPEDVTPAELREDLDVDIAYLREVARILAALHGTPDLGNKRDPVDELVYIILSRKTREEAYQDTFERLKKRFSSWDDLLKARRPSVEKLIRGGGLSAKKTTSLYGALETLRERFGRCTLEPTRSWSDDELEEFLCSLPEIQRKSAYCIMMYSLDREVFPVDTHVGRILARLGPYRDLGLDLTGLDHKQLQATLADLVPPNLRYSLHVNLVIHGREVCRARNPLCDDCELRRFCQDHRGREVARVKASPAPVVIDLFCGAGGLSHGFERAGFRIGAALDVDELATRTYRLNHPSVEEGNVLCRDIHDLTAADVRRMVGRKRLDVLAGAPPCQGFSSAGSRSRQRVTSYEPRRDPRNYLFEEMLALALELKPRLVLLENVPGMRSVRLDDTSFLEFAARVLSEHGGYDTTIWDLNAAQYGVPQDRRRMFLVASSTRHLPAIPEGEYSSTGTINGSEPFLHEPLDPISLDEAVFDLPPVESDSGTSVDMLPDTPAEGPRHRRYLKKFRLTHPGRLLYQHSVRFHPDWHHKLFSKMRPGEDQIHALERGLGARYRKDAFDDKFWKLRPDRPCKTIVSHLAKDGNSYIHPREPRSLSFREGARIQSFPDDYIFCGSPSNQWVQLGNAVPPLLAEAIARSFLKALETGGRRGRR